MTATKARKATKSTAPLAIVKDPNAAAIETALTPQAAKQAAAAAKVTKATAKRVEADQALVAKILKVDAEKAARPSVPNAERRNELPHPDAAAAVEFGPCSCGSKKGVRCLAKSGAETNHVHSARMKAFDAARQPVTRNGNLAASTKATLGEVKASDARKAAAAKKAPAKKA